MTKKELMEKIESEMGCIHEHEKDMIRLGWQYLIEGILEEHVKQTDIYDSISQKYEDFLT